MPVSRPTRERFREVQDLIDRHYTAEPPQVVNQAEAADIDEPAEKEFRGRAYVVPPIPFEDGLKLHKLQFLYHTPGAGVDQVRMALRGMARLFWRLVQPKGRRPKWTLRNPFKKMSEREIIAAADFFWRRRTGLPFLMWWERVAEELAASSTDSTQSTSFRGSTNGGPRRGGTSSMD